MEWDVLFVRAFAEEFREYPSAVKVQLGRAVSLLRRQGPQLGRPWVDRLSGSDFVNMKEIRVTVMAGEWRVAFAFDHKRRAVLLVAGDKAGVSQRLFYRNLIAIADQRFRDHLEGL